MKFPFLAWEVLVVPWQKEQDTLYYSFSNYHRPGSIIPSSKALVSEPYWNPGIDFDSDNYVSKQVFFSSKDGTQIPMIITHKKGVVYKKNPTILWVWRIQYQYYLGLASLTAFGWN